MVDLAVSTGNLPFDFSNSFYDSSEESSEDDDVFVSPLTQIKEHLSEFPNELKIGLSNVQSLLAHFSEFETYVITGNFDVVALTETWLKPFIGDHLIEIPGYFIVRNDRIHKGGGGVAAYIKNSIKATTIFAPVSDEFSPEQLWFEVKTRTKNLTLGIAYRPPNLPISSIQNFDDALYNYANNNDDVILLGDFNVNLLKASTPGGDAIRSMCALHDLSQLVRNPTFICNTTVSLLDLVMVRNCEQVKLIEQTIQPGISHHNFLYLVYNIDVPKIAATLVTTRNWKNLNINQFNDAASKAPWHMIHDQPNINDKVAIMNNIITALLDDHVPYVTFKAKKPPSPWLSDNIKCLMRKRDRMKALFNRTKNLVHWEKYRNLRNKVKNTVRNARITKFDECINQEKNTKRFWNHLRELKVHGIKPGNITDIEPSIINQHFIANQTSTLSDPDLVKKQISHFLDIKSDTTFTLDTVTENEIIDIISGISTNATGADNINLKTIKLFLPFIIPAITHIINFSITSSSFPSLWKLAVINPIRKKGRSTDVTNLRPISILPCLSKVLERVVANQLKSYLFENKILNVNQSGFRSNHSTATALINITNRMLKAMDESKFTSLVLLDFAKAFDTVNHDLLIAKLQAIGVDDLSTKWFYSYLTGRQQCVRVGERVSPYLDVLSGVPQGSILGPLLFSIFINDLPDCINNCDSNLFADDVQVDKQYSSTQASTALTELNSDLKNISNWSRSNGLSLNIDKCQHIVIGTQQLFQAHPPNTLDLCNTVEINEIQLKSYQNVKNLGVIFDQHLSWDEHISTQCRLALQKLRYLYKFTNFLSTNTKRKLVSALIIPLLDYCDTVYYNAAKVSLNKVQKVQNACVRFILNIKSFISVRDNIKSLKWLSMDKRRALHSLLLVFKTLRLQQPVNLYELIAPCVNEHHYATRLSYSRPFTPPRCRTSKYQSSFLLQGMKLWNDLPDSIKSMSTVQAFKKQAFKHFLHS